MKNIQGRLSKILQESLSPLEYAFFYNDNHSDDYLNIDSNIERYKGQNYWDVYSIPSLIRVLTLKNELIAKDCLENFYKEQISEICFVIDWNNEGRKVLIFNIANSSVFKQEVFIKSINENQEELRDLFNEVLND